MGIGGIINNFFVTAPYTSAFCVTAFKATCSDLLAQWREHRAVMKKIEGSFEDNVEIVEDAGSAISSSISKGEGAPTKAVISCDDVSCQLIEVPTERQIEWRRTFAFFLYGGLYQGCVQHFLFNEMFPVWFGVGDDLRTIAIKVLFDQLVLTPFLCLPAAYLFKAIVFKYPLSEGLQRYIADARKDLLIKYWWLWTPTQCLTFGVIPAQFRIAFIASVSFFWLFILSTISSRDDAQPLTDTQADAGDSVDQR